VANSGTLAVPHSTIVGNSAVYSDNVTSRGGGVAPYGICTVTGSTISDNVAFRGGGVAHFGGIVTVLNSTISGECSRG
jgi:hypothetical protein